MLAADINLKISGDIRKGPVNVGIVAVVSKLGDVHVHALAVHVPRLKVTDPLGVGDHFVVVDDVTTAI